MTSVQRIRVPAGFLFAGLYLYFSQPQVNFLLGGLSLAVAGLAFRVWASGHIEKGTRLAVQGPYRWTRNPLYFGSFLMGLGFTLASTNLWLLGLFLFLFLVIYIPVMRKEEEELSQAFGTPFESYRQRVPLFVPYPKTSPVEESAGPDGNFRWRRVILNGEYNTMIGFLIIAALLWVKIIWT
jgi:protein-S-isoprenylcysteine O-methyltransferase Ste14